MKKILLTLVGALALMATTASASSPDMNTLLKCNTSKIKPKTKMFNVHLNNGMKINSVVYASNVCPESFLLPWIKSSIGVATIKDDGLSVYHSYKTNKIKAANKLLDYGLSPNYIYKPTGVSTLDMATMKGRDISHLIKKGGKSNYGRLIALGAKSYEKKINADDAGLDMRVSAEVYEEQILNTVVGSFGSTVSQVMTSQNHKMSQNKSWKSLVIAYQLRMNKIYRKSGFVEVLKEHAALSTMQELALREGKPNVFTIVKQTTLRLDLWDSYTSYGNKTTASNRDRDSMTPAGSFGVAFTPKKLALDSNALTRGLMAIDLFIEGKSAQELAMEDFVPGSRDLYMKVEKAIDVMVKHKMK